MPQDSHKRRVIILTLGGGIAVLLIVSLVLYGTKAKTKPTNNSTTYTDPYSGETISNPGTQPETYGRNPAYPAFFGFSKLFDQGLTNEQYSSLQFYYYNFGQTTNRKIKEVSIDVSTIQYHLHDKNNPDSVDNLTFTSVIDRTTKYNTRVDLINLKNVRLLLMDDSGKVAYDSASTVGSD